MKRKSEGSESPAKFNPLSFDDLGRGLAADTEREPNRPKGNVAVSGNKDAMPIPRTAPGYRGTGKFLHDLNKMYGPSVLKNPKIRAKLRRKYKGEIEIKEIEGGWQITHAYQK